MGYPPLVSWGKTLQQFTELTEPRGRIEQCDFGSALVCLDEHWRATRDRLENLRIVTPTGLGFVRVISGLLI